MSKYREQNLAFFVTPEPDVEVRSRLQNLISDLGTRRKWVIGSPKFIDESLDGRTQYGDKIDILVGGVIKIYSGINPEIPREVDLALLSDVEFLVSAIQDFSRTEKLVFEFELDRDFVGQVDNGVLDQNMKETMLGEWRRHLGVE